MCGRDITLDSTGRSVPLDRALPAVSALDGREIVTNGDADVLRMLAEGHFGRDEPERRRAGGVGRLLRQLFGQHGGDARCRPAVP